MSQFETLSTTTTPTLTTLPSALQQQIYDGVDLAGLAASSRVSRAWLRAVRENSILPALAKLRLWSSASLRKLGVHLTWQSVVRHPEPPPLPELTGMASPLLVLDGLAVWLAHDNEHEAGLQLLQHVSQLVSVGGDGNVEWSTPATVAQREWLTGVSVLPTARVLHSSATLPRQAHVRIAFLLSSLPVYRFYLKLDFQRPPQPSNSSLAVMYQTSKDQRVLTVLLMSDAAELHLVRGVVGFDPQTGMYSIPEKNRSVGGAPAATVSRLEEIGITDARAFLNGICMLLSFVYAPAAQQLQRQIAALMGDAIA